MMLAFSPSRCFSMASATRSALRDEIRVHGRLATIVNGLEGCHDALELVFEASLLLVVHLEEWCDGLLDSVVRFHVNGRSGDELPFRAVGADALGESFKLRRVPLTTGRSMLLHLWNWRSSGRSNCSNDAGLGYRGGSCESVWTGADEGLPTTEAAPTGCTPARRRVACRWRASSPRIRSASLADLVIDRHRPQQSLLLRFSPSLSWARRLATTFQSFVPSSAMSSRSAVVSTSDHTVVSRLSFPSSPRPSASAERTAGGPSPVATGGVVAVVGGHESSSRRIRLTARSSCRSTDARGGTSSRSAVPVIE